MRAIPIIKFPKKQPAAKSARDEKAGYRRALSAQSIAPYAEEYFRLEDARRGWVREAPIETPAEEYAAGYPGGGRRGVRERVPGGAVAPAEARVTTAERPGRGPGGAPGTEPTGAIPGRVFLVDTDAQRAEFRNSLQRAAGAQNTGQQSTPKTTPSTGTKETGSS